MSEYYTLFHKLLKLPRGQSSPGSLQSGQQFSKASRQIPQVSSLATHRQVATPNQPKLHNLINYSIQKRSKM